MKTKAKNGRTRTSAEIAEILRATEGMRAAAAVKYYPDVSSAQLLKWRAQLESGRRRAAAKAAATKAAARASRMPAKSKSLPAESAYRELTKEKQRSPSVGLETNPPHDAQIALVELHAAADRLVEAVRADERFSFNQFLNTR